MRIIKLVGVIDRIEQGIAAVVPDNGERELYIPAEAIYGASEGMKIDCLVVQGKDPNAICRVVPGKTRKVTPPSRLHSFSILVKAIDKTLAKLRMKLTELEGAENPDSEVLQELQEKIQFLEKGNTLFRKQDDHE